MQFELLDKQAAAAALGISKVSVDRLRKDGVLPYRQIGGLVRFTPEDLSTYLENSLNSGLQRRGEVRDATA